MGWQIENILREEAVKARLKDLLGGPQTPALLMTASHGMEFPLTIVNIFRNCRTRARCFARIGPEGLPGQEADQPGLLLCR